MCTNNDLHIICRLCLCNSFKYYKIFSDEGKKLRINEIIKEIFPLLKINNEHNKPQKIPQIICLACYHVVNNFYNYYKEVLSNQTYFDKLSDEFSSRNNIRTTPNNPKNKHQPNSTPPTLFISHNNNNRNLYENHRFAANGETINKTFLHTSIIVNDNNDNDDDGGENNGDADENVYFENEDGTTELANQSIEYESENEYIVPIPVSSITDETSKSDMLQDDQIYTLNNENIVVKYKGYEVIVTNANETNDNNNENLNSILPIKNENQISDTIKNELSDVVKQSNDDDDDGDDIFILPIEYRDHEEMSNLNQCETNMTNAEELSTVSTNVKSNTKKKKSALKSRQYNLRTKHNKKQQQNHHHYKRKSKCTAIKIDDEPSDDPRKIQKSLIDIQLPECLRTRMKKEKSDELIREFVRLYCYLCLEDDQKLEFDTFKKLQIHYLDVHKCKGYAICCDKKMYRKDRLLDHITNHVNPDAFKCPLCKQNSKSKVLLRIHMKQHLPATHRRFKCEKCDQRFVLKSQLTNHHATHYTADQRRFVCEICNKAFALKFVLIKHRLTHTKEKNFICEICAKSFTCYSNLQTHMSQHFDPSPRVQCNICNSWYKNVDTLRSHMQRHTDNRKHICQICEKECSTPSSLVSHIRYVHHKTKRFECTVCQQGFRKKIELNEHMARHTGKTLYKCPFCAKTFASSSNYFSHRKNRHPLEFQILQSKRRSES